MAAGWHHDEGEKCLDGLAGDFTQDLSSKAVQMDRHDILRK